MPYGSVPEYDTPADDVRIWRYLTFPKFVHFLRYGLWMPSIGTVRGIDEFDGTHTRGEFQHLAEITRDGRFVQDLAALSEYLTAHKTFVS